MSDEQSYLILFVNNVPVDCEPILSDNQAMEELKDRIPLYVNFPLKIYGTGMYDGARIDDLNELEEWMNYHGGMLEPCVGFLDDNGDDVYFYIANSFYTFNFLDEIDKDVYYNFCEQNGISID